MVWCSGALNRFSRATSSERREPAAVSSARCAWRRCARATGERCCRGAATPSTWSAWARGCVRAAVAPCAAPARQPRPAVPPLISLLKTSSAYAVS
ncbi:hypothetical protein PR202_gb09599 [Eleusine coracana subsp. coracana]|uniref:Uncharacterized protein n=1 Tax=Eleusine coracana subsp. coracana TaxID=191504 RepID=A0AAV5EH69_ELECO|nr:hypothetical protein PR202_gb09599 [Eleusine coracana subsp. coracana]